MTRAERENSTPADQAARDAALDLERSFIVQAPAGSGKTELLTQRYLKLLSRVKQPERILAITFTRKATQEMRNRIMQRLRQAREHKVVDSHERRAVELAAAVLAQNDRLHWGLLDNPGRLRIFTIDALCAQLLLRDPQYGAAVSHLQVLEDARPIYRQAIRRMFEDLDAPQASELSGDDGLDSRLVRVLVHLDGDTLRLEELLMHMLAIRDQWTGSLSQQTEVFKRVLDERQVAELAAFEAALGAGPLGVALELAARLGAGLQDAEHPAARLAGLNDAGPGSVTASLWKAHWLAQLLTTGNNKPRGPRGITRKSLFPELDKEADPPVADLQAIYRGWCDDAFALRAIERMAAAPPLDSGLEQDSLLDDVLTLLQFLLAELKLVVMGEGKADFQFLAERALLSLRANQPEGETYSEVLLSEDRRLDHLLLDEFQDTSHTQHRLVRQLTGGWSHGDGRTVFLVGDPMQSIYRFRAADVGLFTRVVQQGRIGNVSVALLKLTANFRSRREVIDWVNQQFAEIFPAQDERDSGAVRYHPAAAEQSCGGSVGIHAFTPNESDEDEARLIAAVIRDYLEWPDIGSIAVLVRARSHLQALARELVHQKIDFEAVKVDALASRPVIQDLLAITRALLHPADRVAAAALLRAPWCGLRLPELHRVVGEQPHEDIWKRIKQAQDDPEIAAQARQRIGRLSQVLEGAVELRSVLRLREQVEFAWLELGAPFSYADDSELDNAAAFLALLDRIEQEGSGDLLERLNEGLDALFARARPARVQLMTIHQAKGLEFDVVILPALHRTNNRSRQPLIFTQQFALHESGFDATRAEDSALLMAPVTRRGGDGPSIYGYLAAVDAERQSFESVRLLYVAATRAKKHLHLCGRLKFSPKNGCYADSGSFLRMLLPAFEPAFNRRNYPGEAEPRGALQEPVSLPLLRLTGQPEIRLEPPLLQKGGALELPELPERNAVALGQALHQWLELLHDQWDRNWTGDWFDDHTAMLESLLLRAGADPGSISELLPRLRRMIRGVLDTDCGRSAVSPDRTTESHAELALLIREGSSIGRRVIDRLFCDEEGRWHIVDYKSGGSGEAQMQRWNEQLGEYGVLVRGVVGGELPDCRIYQAEACRLVPLDVPEGRQEASDQ